jgi:hypothetical protein
MSLDSVSRVELTVVTFDVILNPEIRPLSFFSNKVHAFGDFENVLIHDGRYIIFGNVEALVAHVLPVNEHFEFFILDGIVVELIESLGLFHMF